MEKATNSPNKIEKQTFFGFYIHTATERYQQSGYREDAYAENTDRYADYHGAIECMVRDCGFVVSDNNQSLAMWGMK